MGRGAAIPFSHTTVAGGRRDGFGMKFGIFYEISVPRPWEARTEYEVY